LYTAAVYLQAAATKQAQLVRPLPTAKPDAAAACSAQKQASMAYLQRCQLLLAMQLPSQAELTASACWTGAQLSSWPQAAAAPCTLHEDPEVAVLLSKPAPSLPTAASWCQAAALAAVDSALAAVVAARHLLRMYFCVCGLADCMAAVAVQLFAW
jgi:hypothetical protein